MLATFAHAGVPETKPGTKRERANVLLIKTDGIPKDCLVKPGGLHTLKGRMVILIPFPPHEDVPKESESKSIEIQNSTDMNNNYYNITEFRLGMAIIISEYVRFYPPPIHFYMIPYSMSPLDVKTGGEETE